MSITSFFSTRKPVTDLLSHETGNDKVLKLKEACLLTDDEDLMDFCTTKKYPTNNIHKYCRENPENKTCKDLQELNKENTGGKKRRVKKSRKSRKSSRKNHKKRATRRK